MASPPPAAPLRGCPWLPRPRHGANPSPPKPPPPPARPVPGGSAVAPAGVREGTGLGLAGRRGGTRQQPSESHLPPDCIGARQSPGGLAPGMELAYSGYRDMAERNLAPRHPFSSPPLRPPLPPPAPHHHHHPPLQIPQPSRRSQCKGTPGGARKGGEALGGGPRSRPRGPDLDHAPPTQTAPAPRVGKRERGRIRARHPGGSLLLSVTPG